jgi:exopolysaccharide biosynthesis polyprenyl glycosylphosphotransferase
VKPTHQVAGTSYGRGYQQFRGLFGLVSIGSLAVIDAVGVLAAMWLAFVSAPGVESPWMDAKDHWPAQAFIVWVLFLGAGLYRPSSQRPGFARVVAVLAQATALGAGLVAIGAHDVSAWVFLAGFVASIGTIGLLRYLHSKTTTWLLRTLGYRRRAVLVGTGQHIEQVAQALDDAAHSPINVVGFISLTPRPEHGLRSLGSLRDIPTVIGEHRVDEVIIADPAFPQQEVVELVDQCHRRGVAVRVAPSTMEILIHRTEFVPGQSVPLFELKPPVFEGIDYAMKRTFDVVGATLLLFFLSPLLLASVLAIKLTSRGPIIYRSIRPGIGGVPFACFKFRTMYADAELRQADLEEANEASGALFKIKDDPRTTKVGRVLRKCSIDDLPQLVNVLRGQMSLVGPRPLPLRDFEHLEDWHKKRYLVMPGITGLWQVSGRSELDFDDLVRLDFLYLERWSIFLDLSILIKTIPAVFSRRGAF